MRNQAFSIEILLNYDVSAKKQRYLGFSNRLPSGSTRPLTAEVRETSPLVMVGKDELTENTSSADTDNVGRISELSVSEEVN